MNLRSLVIGVESIARSAGIIAVLACMAIFTTTKQAYSAQLSTDTHLITLKAANLPSGQLAYQMVSHKIKSKKGKTKDVTDRYSDKPSIPGPTML